MVRRKRVNPVGGLGVRYGKRVRVRLSEAGADLRRKHVCQNCGFKAVSRLSVGVWTCSKCALTFTGAAYSPSSELGDAAKRSIRRSA
jgi:large subunit ribosomal protein L37Ae